MSAGGRSFPLDGNYWRDEKGRYPDLTRGFLMGTAFVLILSVLLWLIFVVWR